MSLYKQTLFNVWQTATTGVDTNVLDSSLCPDYSSIDVTEILEGSPIVPAIKIPPEVADINNPPDPIDQEKDIIVIGDTLNQQNDNVPWKIMQRHPIDNVVTNILSLRKKSRNIPEILFTVGIPPYVQNVIMQIKGDPDDIYRSVASPNISSVQLLVNTMNVYINHVEIYAHRTISVADFSRVYYTVLRLRRPSLSTFTSSMRQALIDEGTILVNDAFTVYVKYEWGVYKPENEVTVIVQSSNNSNVDINGVPIGAEIDDPSAPLYNSLDSPITDFNTPKLINADIQILSQNGNNTVFESIFDDVNVNNPGTAVMRQFLRLPETLFNISPVMKIIKFNPYEEYKADELNPNVSFEISSRDS